MSTTLPLLGGLPPSSWPDATLGRTAPKAAAGHSSRDWFAQAGESARVLSVQFSGPPSTDVDGWTLQLVGHLLEPAEGVR